MYDFAIVMLLGLAVFKVVDLIEDFVPRITHFHLLATALVAVAATLAIDYSVFARYGIELRNADLGVWLTGFMIAGTTSAWRAAFHWFGVSEGDEPEMRHHLRSAA